MEVWRMSWWYSWGPKVLKFTKSYKEKRTKNLQWETDDIDVDVDVNCKYIYRDSGLK